jgi:hypothetical protein
MVSPVGTVAPAPPPADVVVVVVVAVVVGVGGLPGADSLETAEELADSTPPTTDRTAMYHGPFNPYKVTDGPEIPVA